MARKLGDTGFSTFACANSLPAYAFVLQIACFSAFAFSFPATGKALARLLKSLSASLRICFANCLLLGICFAKACQPTHLLCKLLGQAAVLDSMQIKRLIKIAVTVY